MRHSGPPALTMNRRACLAAALATPFAASAAWASSRPFFRRHGLPLGLQLYALGDISATLDAALGRLASIGYRTVELAGHYGRTPTELRQALDKAGLKCTSSHVMLGPNHDFAKLAAEARVIGFDRVITPMFNMPAGANLHAQAGESYMDVLSRVARDMTPEQWKAQAAFLNRAGETLRAEGLRLGYHNHNVEFSPRPDGRTGYDILLHETNPALVTFEMDAGWVASTGLDPIQLLKAHPGRFELMHVKDLKASNRPNFALQIDATEVGSGTMDWKHILPVAYAAGVRRFFVEQEPPFIRDRLEAAKINFQYLDGLVA
jgi:sugar phosphate isomerase/epimerase